MMPDDHDDTAAEAVARQYGISVEEARRLIAEHGREGMSLDDTIESLAHFFRSPS